MMELREIPLTLLDTGVHEQRFDYADPQFEDLKTSLRKDGVLVPLIVRPIGDRFLIVEGHRRYKAALDVTLTTVPCLIQAGDVALSKRTAFIVNLFRKDPTPVEMAVAIARTIDAGQDSLEEIAHGLGRSPDWVKRQVALLDWPDDVLQAVHRGSLSLAAAANLAIVEEPAYRSYLLENAVENGATARTTAAWLQAWRACIPFEKALEQPPVPATATAQPMVPQAPCIVCGGIFRTDELSHVPVCARDVQRLRQLDQP